MNPPRLVEPDSSKEGWMLLSRPMTALLKGLTGIAHEMRRVLGRAKTIAGAET